VSAPLWVAIPVIALVITATGADVRSRRIPNRLTGTALLLGIAVHLAWTGPAGAGHALLGALVAGAVLFPGWLLGTMGAGDVKLIAAVGAWLGYPGGLVAAVASLLAGGVFALIAAARHGVLLQSLRRTAALAGGLLSGRGITPALATSGVRFPFAPAVLVATMFVLWRQG
jgi:prepilin peptidase CpaA